ncbi:hypothetical protein MPPM_0508 [Methylorubrum populi]|uniref:Uncharacterized protein n=1 Tax=Methylorubrum populi TaxID=223967 RepID=A0A160PBB8_9HYPH|nr:hypothetical protein [Methylorubrum populi]BAU89113.1 hypothetical protein MPPM_0508 [Methylorubrum populi]
MSMSVGGRASFPHAFALGGDRDLAASQEGFSPLRLLRAACTPANLLVCAVVAFGWFALIGWTGAGPDGWQARLCADLDLQPRACAAVQLTGEAGHTASASVVGTAS